MGKNVDRGKARLGTRALAVGLDGLLFFLVSVPLLYAIHGRSYFQSQVPERGAIDMLNMFVLPHLLVIFFWMAAAATPGKLALCLRIVDARSGQAPTPRQVILRLMGCYLAALPLGLGFLWIAFDPEKRGWHDRIAGTAVVCRNRSARA